MAQVELLDLLVDDVSTGLTSVGPCGACAVVPDLDEKGLVEKKPASQPQSRRSFSDSLASYCGKIEILKRARACKRIKLLETRTSAAEQDFVCW